MLLRKLLISCCSVTLACAQYAEASKYVISPNTSAPKGNLSPALLVIRNGGGSYLGETDDGRSIFELPDTSPLVENSTDYNVDFSIEPLGERKVLEPRDLIVSYRPGKKPTKEQIAEAGFKIVEDYDRGTMMVIRPTRDIELSAESIKNWRSLAKWSMPSSIIAVRSHRWRVIKRFAKFKPTITLPSTIHFRTVCTEFAESTLR